MSLLTVRDLTVRFGGVTALAGVGLDVEQGQICALIGPNGAGKTTAFNAISRLVRIQGGRITFDGTNLLSRRASGLAGLGIARTFQNLALWPDLTVLQNVMVGAHSLGRAGFVSAMAGLNRGEERRLTARAHAALQFFDIAGHAHQPCSGLSFGTLKRVELARALVTRPRLLMLDEPASGLTHGDVRELARQLRRIRDDLGTTLLLVEHHMKLVMDVSDHVVAMDLGRNLVEGPPSEVSQDQRLVDAYLGKSA